MESIAFVFCPLLTCISLFSFCFLLLPFVLPVWCCDLIVAGKCCCFLLVYLCHVVSSAAHQFQIQLSVNFCQTLGLSTVAHMCMPDGGLSTVTGCCEMNLKMCVCTVLYVHTHWRTRLCNCVRQHVCACFWTFWCWVPNHRGLSGWK